MYNQLSIDSDPTTWVLAAAIDASVLASGGPPFAAATLRPLPGILLVSARAAGCVALSSAGGEPHGPIPTDDVPAAPFLYLPSGSGLDPVSPGYQLADGTDAAGLQRSLTAAMTDGTLLTVGLGAGALVLNGAALPFAVIFRAAQAT